MFFPAVAVEPSNYAARTQISIWTHFFAVRVCVAGPLQDVLRFGPLAGYFHSSLHRKPKFRLRTAVNIAAAIAAATASE